MNNNLTFQLIKNDTDIISFYNLANRIWHEYFPCILEKNQIDYMVHMFFNQNTVKQSINDSYEFYFVKHNNENIGFIVIHPEKEKLFLSKFYLELENRGKGFAAKMMDFVKNKALEFNLNSIYLTVNKYNTHTIDVYKHFGYKTICSEQTDIGEGFIMDDFVMELIL